MQLMDPLARRFAGRFSRRFMRWLPALAAYAVIAIVAVAADSSGIHATAPAQPQNHGRTLAEVAHDLGLNIGDPRIAPAAAALPSGKGEGEKDLALLGVQGGHPEEATLAATKASDKQKDLSERTTLPPGPDDWHIITNSLTLFRHAPFVIDLVLGLTVAIFSALVLTATPQRAVRFDPVARMDQRKATVLVALIGCIAAELVQASEQFLLGAEIALVLFGIGGLVRFRTLFSDARETGVAIIAAILGLAAGMSEYSLVLLALAVVFLANWWLSRRAVLCVRVRLRKHGDIAQIQSALTAMLQQQEFVILRATSSIGRREVELYAQTERDFELNALTDSIESMVPDARVRISAS